MVSTHMSPEAAKVIRVAKMNRDFGILYPHSSSRFLASDGPWVYVSADDEDEAWRRFGEGSKTVLGRFVQGVISFVNYVRRMQLPAKSPIPGSKRFRIIKEIM